MLPAATHVSQYSRVHMETQAGTLLVIDNDIAPSKSHVDVGWLVGVVVNLSLFSAYTVYFLGTELFRSGPRPTYISPCCSCACP